MLDFDHNEAMGRYSRTGLGAIAQLVQTLNVRGREFSAPDVKQPYSEGTSAREP